VLARFRPLWEEALTALWHFRFEGRTFVATSYRARGDRVFANYLKQRSSFFRFPDVDLRGTPEQVTIAADVLEHLRAVGWSILSGCGGSGKTFVLGQIGNAVSRLTIPNEFNNVASCPMCSGPLLETCLCGFKRPRGAMRPVKAVFAAPTNRAVAVMQKVLGEAIVQLSGEGGPTLSCYTLHALTCMRHSEVIDILVVDESSMLAAEHGDIIARCSALRRASLLLVGDEAQLTPVGCGEILRPLLATSGLGKLTTNMRAGAVMAAPVAAMRLGEVGPAVACASTTANEAERCAKIREALEPGAQVLALCNEDRVRFCCHCVRLLQPTREPADDFSEGRDSPFNFVPFAGEPVRFQTNRHKQNGACRGSLGVVAELRRMEVEGHSERWTVCVETLGQPTVLVHVECGLTSIGFELRPAYAITVHDAQGGEFESVHVMIPQSPKSPLCNREMLYTAASRAKKSLRFWTTGGNDLEEYGRSLSLPSSRRAAPFHAMIKE